MRRLKLAKTSRMPQARCLACSLPIDAASGIVDKQARNTLQPKPGDLSICIRCGYIARFDKKLRLRRLTKSELEQCAADERLVQATYAIANMRKTPITTS